MINLNYIALLTITNKEITRILRIWLQTILPSIITLFLYFFVFGFLIGKRIGTLSGYDYINYITPGLIMMIIINNSYSNSVSSFFSAKFQKYIEEIIISPTSNSIIIIGLIFGSFFRTLLILIFIILISHLFSNLYIYSYKTFLLTCMLSIVFFSLLGILNGIIAKKFDDISIIPTFILNPFIYISGVFYSTDILPDTLKIFIKLNPIFYMVNLFKYSIIGLSETHILKSFYIIVFFIIALYLITLYLLKNGYDLKK